MTSAWTLPTPEPIRQRAVRRGRLTSSVCLPECRCPFHLQLHFHFEQLIVVAVPGGAVEETFKAVPFCSFYGPQTVAPLVGPACQLKLDSPVTQTLPPFWTPIGQ